MVASLANNIMKNNTLIVAYADDLLVLTRGRGALAKVVENLAKEA